MTWHKHLLHMFYFISTIFLMLSFRLKAGAETQSINKSTRAMFVFGDSFVDPGNNNNIGTFLKCNFPPYGKNFPSGKATGRFTDGRLITDYTASYAGIKQFIPAYLNSSLTIDELMTGVSFASSGTGLDPLTAKLLGTISLQTQLEYFREVKVRLNRTIGTERTEDLIKKSAFILSAGGTDFILNYFTGLTPRNKTFTISRYQHFLMRNLQRFIQDLSNEGAQKIVIFALPPIGCSPFSITVYSRDSANGRDCVESISSVARHYNRILKRKLKLMTNGSPKVLYADIYTPLIAAIKSPIFGFEVVHRGCCGTGFLETAFLCNPITPLCPNASKYVFWDSLHPTDRAYYSTFTYLIPLIDSFIKL